MVHVQASTSNDVMQHGALLGNLSKVFISLKLVIVDFKC